MVSGIEKLIYAGVVVGLLALGESLPPEFSMKFLRLLSWLVTMIGVSALANGKGKFCYLSAMEVQLIEIPKLLQTLFLVQEQLSSSHPIYYSKIHFIEGQVHRAYDKGLRSSQRDWC